MLETCPKKSGTNYNEREQDYMGKGWEKSQSPWSPLKEETEYVLRDLTGYVHSQFLLFATFCSGSLPFHWTMLNEIIKQGIQLAAGKYKYWSKRLIQYINVKYNVRNRSPTKSGTKYKEGGKTTRKNIREA